VDTLTTATLQSHGLLVFFSLSPPFLDHAPHPSQIISFWCCQFCFFCHFRPRLYVFAATLCAKGIIFYCDYHYTMMMVTSEKESGDREKTKV
jgi:hypothetical protein